MKFLSKKEIYKYKVSVTIVTLHLSQELKYWISLTGTSSVAILLACGYRHTTCLSFSLCRVCVLFFVFFVSIYSFLSLTTISMCLIAGIAEPIKTRRSEIESEKARRWLLPSSETSILGWWFLLRGEQPNTQKRPRKWVHRRRRRSFWNGKMMSSPRRQRAINSWEHQKMRGGSRRIQRNACSIALLYASLTHITAKLL